MTPETLPLFQDDGAGLPVALVANLPTDERMWISSPEFMQLAKINKINSIEALRRCFAGKTWRGFALQVRKVPSVGGAAGEAYQVYVPTLPSGLVSLWKLQHPDAFQDPATPMETRAAPVDASFKVSEQQQRDIDLAQWKVDIIMPALQHRKNSRARAEILRGILARQHVRPDGKKLRISYRAIHEWIERFETAGGILGLIRRPRVESKPRVILSRDFDQQCPLSDEQKAALWDDVREYIKGLYKSSHATIKKIETLANARLVTLSQAAGWADASLENCKVGLAQVRKFKGIRVGGIKAMDAKQFADKFIPRIVRNRSGLQPMEIVMGDVHPVDILTKRGDDSETTARMISWLDLATNRFHYDLVILEKSRGITQAHVCASFVAMVKKWGLPSILYLDNGSEYSWAEMMDGFRKLSYFHHGFKVECLDPADMARRVDDAEEGREPGQEVDAQAPVVQDPIVRAKPYNPQGKAPKEGLFGVLERTVFNLIPGWIGGDRMNKKTHRLGAAPRAFTGTPEAFEEAVANAASFYHAIRQQGALKDQSPNEIFGKFIADGWRGVGVDYGVMMLCFSEKKKYQVRNTGIEISGTIYWDDRMASPLVMGQRVPVHYAKWDTSRIILILKNEDTGKEEVVFANKTAEFGMVERAGAIEQGRRQGVMNAEIRKITDGVKKVDTLAAMAEYNRHAGPAPETPFGPSISLSAEFDAVTKAAAVAPTPGPVKEIRVLPGQWRDEETGEIHNPFPALAELPANDDAWEAEERARVIEYGRQIQRELEAEDEENNSRQAGTRPRA